MARLTLPLRFRSQAHANGTIEASSLAAIGARAVEGDLGRWVVVIDPTNTAATLRFLKQHMPGVEWAVSGEGQRFGDAK